MVMGPHIWDIGADIIVDLFIGDPNTGLGLTGQISFTTLTIQRASDSKFWTSSAYSVTLTTLTMTEVDSTNSPGLYRYTLIGTTGNIGANTYYMHASVSNSPTVEGDTYAIHISRETTVIRTYESEPSIRS